MLLLGIKVFSKVLAQPGLDGNPTLGGLGSISWAFFDRHGHWRSHVVFGRSGNGH